MYGRPTSGSILSFILLSMDGLMTSVPSIGQSANFFGDGQRRRTYCEATGERCQIPSDIEKPGSLTASHPGLPALRSPEPAT